MKIKIGDVETNSVENWKIEPDDRQTLIQIQDGVIVQDFGRYETGDKISCSCKMWKAAFDTVKDYWEKRTLVTVTDEAGNAWEKMRVKVKSWGYLQKFPDTINAEIEFWRV